MEALRFARLVSEICGVTGRSMTMPEIERLATIVAESDNSRAANVSRAAVMRMFEFVVAGGKIEAIKEHRALTGANLKDSKDDIEFLMAHVKTDEAFRQKLLGRTYG